MALSQGPEGSHSCHRFSLPGMRKVLKTPCFSPQTSPHRHNFPPSERLPISSALSLPHCPPPPMPYRWF